MDGRELSWIKMILESEVELCRERFQGVKCACRDDAERIQARMRFAQALNRLSGLVLQDRIPEEFRRDTGKNYVRT